jgi:phosphohistidine phosphatase
MRLYLVRHATAVDAGKFDGPDEDRPLTGRGRLELHSVLPQVAAEEAPPRAVWTSPLVRAVQTAEAVLALWAPGAEIHVTRALLSSADPREILEELAHEVSSPIALVGHEPHLGRLLTKMVDAKPSISMPKAGVARVRWRPDDGGVGTFRALYAFGRTSPVTDLERLQGRD